MIPTNFLEGKETKNWNLCIINMNSPTNGGYPNGTSPHLEVRSRLDNFHTVNIIPHCICTFRTIILLINYRKSSSYETSTREQVHIQWNMEVAFQS